ncbi:MAG: glycosyltransferase [Kastovskya adunca ATA6-11-RM4]|jgi:glycosyltransferase involved in cell wall biosynthesis|nr:glycosyltransferase [Kastovskya adunca ATA6-11-RM4]
MQFDSLEVRRSSIITKLHIAKLSEFLGTNPWVCTANSAYKELTAPSVTIIITLFNYSNYIYECLSSICKSNTSGLPGGFEILVIDDCSTDNSQNLVKEYLAESDFPICLVSKVFNTGTTDARNTGIKLARAPYVFIMDADNWIYPHCLTKLYNAIHNSNYAAVYGIINKFDNNTKEGIGFLSCFEWDVRELVRAPYIDAMAMFDKKVLIKLGYYSNELIEYGWLGWEDYELWLKLGLYNYICKLLPEIVGAYRVHNSSQIHTMNQYTASVAKYFQNKFAALVNRYNDLDKVFGFAIDIELEPGQLHQQHISAELEKSHYQMHLLNLEVHRLQTKIAAMESSKFWKLRKQWFRLRRTIGFSEIE